MYGLEKVIEPKADGKKVAKVRRMQERHRAEREMGWAHRVPKLLTGDKDDDDDGR